MRRDRPREAWMDLLGAWGVGPGQADGASTEIVQAHADRAFGEIVQAYAGPGRYYHTLDHVMDVLATVETLASHATRPDAVRLAAWLHDVVYNSRASDNEERSARYAERLCEELSIPEGPLVAALIRTTKTHNAGDDADARVLIDADLAVLGASEPVYRDYAGKIRREYAWVPEPQYREGRRHVLEGFLARPRIYHFLGYLEEPARKNLAAEIAQLAT